MARIKPLFASSWQEMGIFGARKGPNGQQWRPETPKTAGNPPNNEE